MSRTAPVDPLIGSLIGERYEVLRRIAKGGMGTIYEVRNTRINRSFALKTLTAEAAEDPEVLIRFRREAEVVAKLRHPNIVEVVDWDSLDDGAPFLVMEYLRGEPLATRLRHGGVPAPLAWPELAAFADQVLAALSVAHKAGVTHRDLKPDNIFLVVDDEGGARAKLLDFGISKLRDSKTFATTDARVLGTPAYMSPEQAEGLHDQVGSATDIWAMGGIIYEMATGVVAFDAPSTPAILYRVCHGEATPVVDLRADAPPELSALIARMLTRAVADRPSDVDQVRAELRACLAHLDGVSWPEPLRTQQFDAPLRTPPPGSLTAPSPSALATPALTVLDQAPVGAAPRSNRKRPPVALITGAAIVFVGAVVGAFLLLRGDKAGAPPPPDPRPPVPVQTAPTTPDPAPPVVAPVPPAPVMIDVTITSRPAGAEVWRMPSEVKVGKSPWSGQIEGGDDGVAVFLLRKPKFADATIEVDLRTGGTFDHKLVPAKKVKKPAGKKPGRRKGEPADPFAGGNK